MATPSLDFGKHKSAPLSKVPLDYMLFLLSRNHFRQSRPEAMRLLLREFSRRLGENYEAAIAEMLTPVFPPTGREERKKAARAEKAEKLRQLTQRRAEERAQRRAEYQAARAVAEMDRARLETATGLPNPGEHARLARHDAALMETAPEGIRLQWQQAQIEVAAAIRSLSASLPLSNTHRKTPK